MGKDFIGWSDVKTHIDETSFRPLFHEREIWWCALGANIGREEDGKNASFERPVLIFRRFNSEIFLGMPLSSVHKNGIYYFPYILDEKESVVLLSQLRILDAKRLHKRMSVMSKENFELLEEQFNNLMVFTKEKPPTGAESQPSIVSYLPLEINSGAEAIVEPL